MRRERRIRSGIGRHLLWALLAGAIGLAIVPVVRVAAATATVLRPAIGIIRPIISVTVSGIVATGVTTASGAAAGDAIANSNVQLFAAGDTTAVASATSGSDGSFSITFTTFEFSNTVYYLVAS
jgi:hypothetical protein